MQVQRKDTTVGESDFTVSFVVEQPPEAVFAAINDVRGWWTGNIEGETDALGATFTYHYEDVHYSKQTISELIPGRRVVWHVDEASLNFASEPDEWVGTAISFEITPLGAGCVVRFTHLGLTPKSECYEGCSDAWTFYVSKSLPELIRTGAGNPIPAV